MNPEACNYDENATIDDDSCDYSCLGCTDPEACNYDEDATIAFLIEDAFELGHLRFFDFHPNGFSHSMLALKHWDATFTLDFSGQGGSYPADMMVYIYAPNGNCIVWGGWNVMPMGDCEDEGTGVGNAWPQNWNTTAAGEYTYELDLMSNNLGGSGDWTLTIQNGWTGG